MDVCVGVCAFSMLICNATAGSAVLRRFHPGETSGGEGGKAVVLYMVVCRITDDRC